MPSAPSWDVRGARAAQIGAWPGGTPPSCSEDLARVEAAAAGAEGAGSKDNCLGRDRGPSKRGGPAARTADAQGPGEEKVRP